MFEYDYSSDVPLHCKQYASSLNGAHFVRIHFTVWMCVYDTFWESERDAWSPAAYIIITSRVGLGGMTRAESDRRAAFVFILHIESNYCDVRVCHYFVLPLYVFFITVIIFIITAHCSKSTPIRTALLYMRVRRLG